MPPVTEMSRVSTGVPGFDEIVDGGLPADRLYILSGPPGSGKTTFALQFAVAGQEAGERALYLSMHETAPELVRAMSGYGFDLERRLGTASFRFMNVFEDEEASLLQPEQEADYRTSLRNQVREIREFVAKNDLSRVVIDSTMLLRHFFSNDHDAFITFLTGLKHADATVLLISEMTDPTAYADDHYLAHGLVFLHNFLDERSQEMQRGVQVIKMRGTPIDTRIHAASFGEAGLEVDPERSIEA